MPEPNQLDINSLHHAVLRESESDTVLEIAPDFYRGVSEFIGGLRGQEFDGIEEKIREEMVSMASELARMLLEMRMEKIRRGRYSDLGHLPDEEKFILDPHGEQEERTGMVVSATVRGQTKFLESLSEHHKKKRITVRFLRDVDALVGADLEKYGPFRAEDIAAVPHDNAQALISQGAVARVRWED